MATKSYLIHYSGNLRANLSSIPGTAIIPLTPYIAAITIDEQYESQLSEINSISVLEPEIPYILTDISPLESANISQFTEGTPINLTGTGVVVGLIDTGIDYTNNEFLREDDTSRILTIWDQSDSSGTAPPSMGFGSEYSNDDINRAIAEFRAGKDPASIVPERDTIGHGTECAGIIGARGQGEIKGAAPNCEFAVVKLRVLNTLTTDATGTSSIPLYSNVDIATAIIYLIDFRQRINRPMVVFLPVSSNYGGHDGGRPIEEIIDFYSFSASVFFAVGTGNQGNSQTHASGKIPTTNDSTNIQLQVGANQPTLNLSIWCNYPDKMSVGITSPSGQVVSRIPAKIFQRNSLNFLYEKTTVDVTYFFPIITTGNETIDINFTRPAQGIWRITLYGDYIVNGTYNGWISQRPISRPGTLLLDSDNFSTITIPSTSQNSITTAFYNQNTNSLVDTSGVGYTTDNMIKPDLTAGGINVQTTTINNRTTTISGSSAATAVLAGAMTLLLQWAITDKNLLNISSEIMKALLIEGTRKRDTDTYPNPYSGYGQLDLKGTFDAIRNIYRSDNPIL